MPNLAWPQVGGCGGRGGGGRRATAARWGKEMKMNGPSPGAAPARRQRRLRRDDDLLDIESNHGSMMNANGPATSRRRSVRRFTANSPVIIFKRKLKGNSSSTMMMWALGLSLCSILTLMMLTGNLTIILGSSSENRHGRRSAIGTAAKALKKAIKPGHSSKLIDARNVNRGAEGTVTKDMRRGPPLKELLPEDTDDEAEWDDDQWYEHDEEKPWEERQLMELERKEKAGEEGEPKKEATKAEKKEAKREHHAEEEKRPEDATKEKEHDLRKEHKWHKQPEKEEEGEGKKKERQLEAKKAQADKPSEEEAKKAAEPKKQHEGAAAEAAEHAETKKKTPTRAVPRKWESNADAVMKIIDVEHEMTLDADGKKAKEESADSGDSEDSEDEGEEEPEDRSTYLPFPDLAAYAPDEAAAALLSPEDGLTRPLKNRLSKMFEKARTHECRKKIAEHAALFVNGFAEETKFPFDDFHYPNTCRAIPRYADWENLPEGVRVQDVQYRTYQPPREEAPEGAYLENAEELQLLYVILTHDRPEATIRLMESVYVPERTKFVIHVDGKEGSDATYERLVAYAEEKNDRAVREEGKEEYVRIVPNGRRVRVNWGGFSMVDATLKALHTVFGLDYYDEHPDEEGEDSIDNPHAFKFHKLVHLASTTYPLASNTEIRDTLSSYPLDANFLHIILRPNNPTPSVWNYFVECDDALHRIYRLPALNFDRGNGVDIYTSSQWFVISRDFAWYLASPPTGSFVEYYLTYIEHVVVADEAFFGTVIRNTHFCATLHNDNFLHLQFDRWENEADGKRDERKCIMKNPNHCGRSPTTLTVDYLPVLELSGDLFARKFDDDREPLIKDYIDTRRRKDEERFAREAALAKETRDENGTEVAATLPLEDWEFQGEGVLMVAKETLGDDMPLCMGLSTEGNRVLLRPCFKGDVPSTLSPGWEEGAVIVEEIDGLNRWDIGPCSSDGELRRNATGELEMIPGEYSERGPSCGIKLGDGPRRGRCLDVQSDRTGPGGLLNVYPCYTRWHQMFSFGNGTIAPRGAVHATLPAHVASQLRRKEDEVHPHLCLGVVGRGDMTESWVEYTEEEMEEYDPWEYEDVERYPDGRKSLQLWSGQQLQTTPCSNEGAVIEWYYVPFIVEEYEDEDVESSENMTETDEEL